MIPILYKSNETNSFHQGLGPLTEGKPAKVTEARNGEFTFSMEYSIDGKLFSELQNERIIKADAGHALKNQRFVIKHISKPMKGYVKIYAEHVSYKAAEIPLLPHVTVSGTAQQALQQWQNNFIGNYKPFTVSSNITTQNRTTWSLKDVQNARQALGGVEGSILDTWGGEYKFDNFHISLLRERGVKANAMIAYGRNLVDFEQEESILNTYTSIYPYALWRDDEGDEHLITANGYIVDSDYVDNYPNRKVLPVDFTIEFEADEKPSSARLIQLAERYIVSNDIGIPEVSIRLTHQELSQTLDYKDYEGIEEINLCDNVMVKFLKLGVDTTAKVVRIVWNVNLERYDEIEIGAIRTSLSERLNTIDRQVKVAQRDAEDARNRSSVAANGINMVFFGPVEPTATKVGDRWFEENGEFTISRVWDGVIWRVIHDPRITDDNKRAIEAHQQDIQSAQSAADTANQQINDAINAAGFSTLADLTADIQSISNRADANALTAIDNALSASTTAESAMTLATDLSGQVSDFELTVDGFNQTVNNYTDQVAQFTSDVNGLSSTVASYESQVGEFGNTVSTYATQVSQFENTVDGLNSTVSNYQSDVQGYQAQVSTLTNTVDGFNATVQRVEADYGELSGTVQSLGASIGVVEGQITNRVWQTDIQSAVDGIEVGGRNYYRLSELKNLFIVGSGGSISSGSAWKGFYIPVISGEVYSLSRTTKDNNRFRIAFTVEEPISGVPAFGYRQYDDELVVEGIKVPENANYLFIYISYDQQGEEFPYIKLEKGNKSTDWTPAPEDTLQLISNVETEWRQTAQGFEQSITRIESDVDGKASLVAFNTLTNTVDGTVQRIGDAEGNITQIEANVNGLQTTVADKASQTEVTQLANGFNVLSTNFNNLEIGGRNYIPNSERELSRSGTNAHFGYVFDPTPLVEGEIVTVSFEAKSNLNDFPMDYYFRGGATNNLPQTDIYVSAEYKRYAIQMVVPSWKDSIETVHFRPRNEGALYIRRVKLEKGNKATDWTPAPEDMASQAQFTVLQDAINLRVAKGEVMSQINIEAGRTLIESERLYLDAESVIFSGKAFIPDAAIETLTADKLTAGTIDASNINVINLNVNSLVGNRTDFVQSTWNDITNDIHISAAEGFVSTGHFTEETHNGFPLDFFGQVKVRNGYIDMTAREVGVSGAQQSTAHLSGGSLSLRIGNFTSTVDPTGYRMYQGNTWLGGLSLETFDDGATGVTVGSGELRMTQNRIETLRNGNRHLALAPSGTGRLMVRSLTGQYYPVQADQYLFENTANRIRVVGSDLRMEAGSLLNFYSYSDQLAFRIGGNINAHKNIHMQGNSITNQSDGRYKHIIDHMNDDVLDMYRALDFVHFEYTETDKAEGVHFGLIAQHAGRLGSYDSDSDRWMINSSDQIMYNSLGIKQLANEQDNLLKVASHAYLLAEQHEDELAEAKRKIKELEEKVERLEGAA